MRWAVLVLVATGLHADSDYYRHVFFDNSLTSDRFYYSGGTAIGPSRLALDHGRLPVDTHTWFTPPNALRLQWTSAPNGSWEATITVESWRNRPAFDGVALSFMLYSPEEIASVDLPSIQLASANGGFTAPASLETTVAAGKWTYVEVPLEHFKSISTEHFDWRELQAVSFLQRHADARPHTLLVDDIHIEPPRAAPTLVQVPGALSARGYERHVELTWRPVDAADHYVIYRSYDGRQFEPVGIQARSEEHTSEL